MSSSPASPTVSLTPGAAGDSARASANVSNFRLENGLEIVVIPDARTPVVTHMIWYKNGSADDPLGKSGIAHFLEHLMFKGTKDHPQGEFSNLVAELGGQENAFTSYDYTAYFQRIGKEHLGTLMAFEADRMSNLVLTDEVVTPERDVVLEERRMRTDNDPSSQLDEAVQAALFAHHPYGTPIIGWNHEIESLDREDALAYYSRFYTPENAILVVAGDVEADDVLALAKESYGKIPARAEPPRRNRTKEPPHRAHRLVSLCDEKVEQPAHERVFLVPSYKTAAPGEAEALEALAYMLGGGATSALYETLVVEEKVSVGAGAYYLGSAVDDTRLWVYATPAPDVTLDELDRAIDRVIKRFIEEPIDEAHLSRAKTRLVADAVYAQDSQASLARWYGEALATGLTIEDVASWPERVEAVTAADVTAAARKWLDKRRSVTGFLLPCE
ncbi:M16 family metallopeptidase [Methylocystis parvus]|uniref:Insulinase family protein n=1 Tax=Methylocystis parvus TaxID=134 RepID=A0A6B8M3E5_9HYPH|nr:pitrilysin family protein [Methylocystis parvus]QGM96875.1 insulinase family protein [Methylocystis parvus]WBJ99243.1 insulinase family protein [Methylocystis parvus OBBP]